jgi:hypothetical protein
VLRKRVIRRRISRSRVKPVLLHAVEHGQASSPNPKASSFDRIAATPGMTGTALYVSLRTPHRAMPDLILKKDEIRNLASYILSLKDTP